jgi:hypothetical protein
LFGVNEPPPPFPEAEPAAELPLPPCGPAGDHREDGDRYASGTALAGSVPFQILDALVELLVGKMDKSPCFAKLLLDGLVPDAFSFDVDRQAFG